MEDFNQLEGDEKLKSENEFLKMKLMLEHGANFGGDEKNKLPAEIEDCTVKGQYKAIVRLGSVETIFAGSYDVKLAISELGYWDMKEIQINGFNLD